MPALKKTAVTGCITYIGSVAEPDGGLRAVPVQTAQLTWDGLEGENRHSGLTRPSCSRVTSQHARGTEIRNVRQVSVLSEEELADIAAKIGLERLDPGLLGASLVIEGIPSLTHLPPSSRLQMPSGATLVVDMENRPCTLPSREIEADHAGHGKSFKTAAKGKRGVTAWVERPGAIAVGESVVLHVPDQPAWPHLAEALRG